MNTFRFLLFTTGKTKNVRELEEQNLAISDQLTMAQAEISTLHNQLAVVRTQKHQAEQEWAASAREQEQRILALQQDNEELKLAMRRMQVSLLGVVCVESYCVFFRSVERYRYHYWYRSFCY